MVFQGTGLDGITWKVNVGRENSNTYILQRRGRYTKKEWSRGKEETRKVYSFKSSKMFMKEGVYEDSNFFTSLPIFWLKYFGFFLVIAILTDVRCGILL